MNRVLGLVMKHYNGVARTLNKRPDCYGPLFAVDERHNDILWELRIVGFEKAVKPRPAAWQRTPHSGYRNSPGDIRPPHTRRCRSS